ncbi:MAG TPA: hypothetical protein PLD20_03995 [Blastocatellia bacterium]|nr:hypothetical protein [Blastocatellia bacterium]HMY71764.1 hypothetical protein [Blastocatellia bacterium]HMZ17066.1 hypothetical protein [Blastocatellia bacterium]HNG33003.1 hypothetical protein [Blastocatellia bacterium]
MPIRVMVWNIQRFGLNKMIGNNFDPGGTRGTYIEQTILQEVQPDILIVIEVCTGQHAGVGTLITDPSGGAGVTNLLQRLNGGNVPQGNWRVVPPLVLNPNLGRVGDRAYSEGIAVFFDRTRLDFTGPNKWTGDENHQGSQPIQNPANPNANGPASVAYDGTWLNALPTTVPVGNSPNLAQNQLAGRAIFNTANNQQVFFPDIYARNPWLTTFVEKNGNAAVRQIKLFSVHFPPDSLNAKKAVANLAYVPAVTAPLVPGEVRLILGDFNIDNMSYNEASIFEQLTADVNRIGGRNKPTTDIYTTLFFDKVTMLDSVPYASVQGLGPYYGYVNHEGYDNILVAGAAGLNPRVVNRVVGTPPQDAVPPPPAVYSVAMVNPIPNIRGLVGQTDDQKNAIFNAIGNFGTIGGSLGASDHMALVVEV